MLKAYNVRVSVPGLPEYRSVWLGKSREKVRAMVPNPLGGKVTVNRITDRPVVRLAFPAMRLH